MTYRGRISGKVIELTEEPPFPVGAAVEVAITSGPEGLPTGSPALVRRMMSEPPFPDAQMVADFEQAMDEARLPVSDGDLHWER